MQLQQLQYFAAVAKYGSINKAAKVLFISQPSLSKAISNLEQELNVRLFERSNKGIVLTAEGKRIYQYTHNITSQLEMIEHISLETEVPQILSVASFPSLTISKLLAAFYEVNKNKCISLHLAECQMQEVISRIASRESEVGILMYHDLQRKDIKRLLAYNHLEYTHMIYDTWSVNVGPKSPFYALEKVSFKDLILYPYISMPDDYFTAFCSGIEVDSVKFTELKKNIYVNDSASVLNLLRSTDAFFLGPTLSIGEMTEYGVRAIPIQNCDIKLDIGWIKRERENLSSEADGFIELVQKRFYKG